MEEVKKEEVPEEKKTKTLPDDVAFRYSVSQSDLIQLGMIIQLAIRSGEWEVTGIRPDPKCKCSGRGHVGRNVLLDQYIPCKCVIKQLKTALLRMKEIQQVQIREKIEEQKKETGLVDVNGAPILKEEPKNE